MAPRLWPRLRTSDYFSWPSLNQKPRPLFLCISYWLVSLKPMEKQNFSTCRITDLLFFKSHSPSWWFGGEKKRFHTWPFQNLRIFFRIGQSLSTSLWALLRGMAEGYQVQAGPEDCWDWRWARPFPEGLGWLFHCTRDNCWSGLWHITEPHVQQAWSQNLCSLGWSIQKWDNAGINQERTLGCHHWRRLPLTKSHDLHNVCFVAVGEAWRSLHHRALEVQNLVQNIRQKPPLFPTTRLDTPDRFI